MMSSVTRNNLRLKKDSLGSIFVASDDALIYAKVISSIETRGDQYYCAWVRKAGLDQHTVDLEKFQNLAGCSHRSEFCCSEKSRLPCICKKIH